jgi:hypothetical protein
MRLLWELGPVRDRVGEAIFARVAGPEGPANRARIHGAPGPRWFGPDRPVRRVHGDAAMFTGGLVQTGVLELDKGSIVCAILLDQA